MVLKRLEWDDFNTEHVTKHGLNKELVEKAVQNIVDTFDTRSGRFLTICKLGRKYVSIVLAPKGRGIYYPVSARSTSKKELRKIYDKTNTTKTN